MLHFAGAVRTHHVTAEAYPVKICAIAAGLFPGIVEIQYGTHVATFQLYKKTVKTCEELLVIHSGGCLQLRCDMAGNAVTTVAADKDADVAYAESLEVVKFFGEANTVASISVTGKYGTIPEVSTNVAVLLAVEEETTVVDSNKGSAFPCHTRRDDEAKEGEERISN